MNRSRGCRLLLASMLVLSNACVLPSHAQVLNLDAAPAGPVLPKVSATTALALQLTQEAEQIEQAMLQQTGHERVASEARACMRRSSAFLLGPSDPRPWNESVAVFAGLRLARARTSVDVLLDAFSNERRAASAATSRPLTRDELGRVDALLTQFANGALEAMRRADATDAASMTEAAARATMPLANAIAILEGRALPDCWPVFTSAESDPSLTTTRDLVVRATDLQSVLERIARAETLNEGLRVAMHAALDPANALPIEARATRIDTLLTLALATNSLPLLDDAARLSLDGEILDACRALGAGVVATTEGDADPTAPPLLLPGPTRAIEVSAQAVALLFGDIAALDAIAKDDEKLHGALVALASAFASAHVQGGMSAGVDRTVAARRCSEAVQSAVTSRTQRADGIARDLRDVAKQLEREYRAAELSALRALVQITTGGSTFADPETVSALERMRALSKDRSSLEELSETVARITALKPALAAEMDRRARLIARLLTDKLKRSDGMRALHAIRAQTALYAPFPLEESLKRDDAALAELSGASSEALANIGASRRVAWAESWARGDTDAPEFAKMDRFARLMSAMESLASREESAVRRRAADALSMWGNWCASRTAFVPATMDSSALFRLACASLLAGDEVRFDADLQRLEVAIPLVALVASLEARLASALPQAPLLASSEIAPIATTPASHAWLAGEHAQFATLCRTLAELEGARTRGEAPLEFSLRAFASSIASNLNNIVRPRLGLTGQIPSIDAVIAAPQPPRGTRAPTAAPKVAPKVAPTTAAPSPPPATTPAKPGAPATPPTPAKTAVAVKPVVAAPKPEVPKTPAGEQIQPDGNRVPVVPTVPRIPNQDRAPRLPRQGSPTDPQNTDPKKDGN